MGFTLERFRLRPQELGYTSVDEVVRLVAEAVRQNRRTILLLSGVPANGKSTIQNQISSRLKRFHGIETVSCDPDDRHDVQKGEVPPEKGRRAMQQTLVEAFDELMKPSRDMVVFPDAGDDLGMRYMMVLTALIISYMWNRFVKISHLHLRELHFNIIQLKVEAPWWLALTRNLTRDRTVDPTLFLNAVRGVDGTFDRMRQLAHASGIIANGLSVEQRWLCDMLFRNRRCDHNNYPIFGQLGRCKNVYLSSPPSPPSFRCSCNFTLTRGWFADQRPIKLYCSDHTVHSRKWTVEVTLG